MRTTKRRFRPTLEVLENRLTPTHVSAVVNGSVLVITKTATGNDDLTITRTAGSFQQLTVSTTAGNTINGGAGPFTTPKGVAAVMVNLGTGNDTLTFDGVTNGPINLSAGLTITGTGGNKTITAQGVHVLAGANLNLSLMGTGAETTTFTDSDVSGAATVNHPGVGNTIFTITTSGAPNVLNNWGSLTINNGQGSDTNTISDTNFAGSATINNGAGETGNTGQFGGSFTNISATNNQTRTTISGSVSITTLSGQSDNELYDYNVGGSVLISAGAGIAGQTMPDFIGVENIKSFPNSGTPVIGGSVTLTDGTVSTQGTIIDLGTGMVAATNPLIINGNLNIQAQGKGPAAVNLVDQRVLGNTSIFLGAQNSGDSLTIQGSSVVSVFGALSVVSNATGSNTFTIQNGAGSTNFTGPVSFTSAGSDTFTLGGNGGAVNSAGNLSIGGFGAGQTITASKLHLLPRANLIVGVFGNSTLTESFTDVSVGGSAGFSHTGAGNVTFTLNTSSMNGQNNWGSLAMTNGPGNHTTTIRDTNFAGGVAISNGGATTGNNTTIAALNDSTVLTVMGGVTIFNSTGPSDTEFSDYDVTGSVNINSGNGTSGQAHTVGIQTSQPPGFTGVPVISGNVQITGYAVPGVNPGLTVNMGIGAGPTNLPLITQGSLGITVLGTGSAAINLNDQRVFGSATITLGSMTSNDTVSIQGSAVTSQFGSLTLMSSAGGSNTFNIQDQVGNLLFSGPVVYALGPGNDTLNLAADSTHPAGVVGAVVQFFGSASFNGGGGANTLHEGTVGTNLFFAMTPHFMNF